MARRTPRGIDEQVAKAEKAVAGKTAIKRNRFVKLTGADKSVNRALETKARSLAGIKGYVTNLAACPDGTAITADFVIGGLHRGSTWFEKGPSARPSPTWQPDRSTTTKKESNEAPPDHPGVRRPGHSHWRRTTTDWSIKDSSGALRRYRTITIQAAPTPSPPKTPHEIRDIITRSTPQDHAVKTGPRPGGLNDR
ncbi:MAG: hypothetical protein IPG94_00010 [Kineosporiaceae bacterium]|nr:hypothetical protein [Kineosporiaceae bacterium]